MTGVCSTMATREYLTDHHVVANHLQQRVAAARVEELILMQRAWGRCQTRRMAVTREIPNRGGGTKHEAGLLKGGCGPFCGPVWQPGYNTGADLPATLPLT